MPNPVSTSNYHPALWKVIFAALLQRLIMVISSYTFKKRPKPLFCFFLELQIVDQHSGNLHSSLHRRGEVILWMVEALTRSSEFIFTFSSSQSEKWNSPRKTNYWYFYLSRFQLVLSLVGWLCLLLMFQIQLMCVISLILWNLNDPI